MWGDMPVTDEPELTRRRLLALSTATAGGAAFGVGSVAAEEDRSRRDDTVESHDGTELALTVYRPAGAAADEPVPMILHSHGWSGSRTSAAGAFGRELEAGFGVLSFDQRGHGESGGQAHVQNPALEGRDVVEILDYVEALEWVADDRGDPTVFAMGGSYGGAYQLVGALTETALTGRTRFDGLAPQITWFDLSESLAPEGVVRSAWVSALYAAGAANVPEFVHRAFLYGSATGRWPDGDDPAEPDLDSRFYRNGPSGFLDPQDGFCRRRVRLDVPVLFGQGTSDNLFNLNQAWKNFERTLAEPARRRSAVVAYNGGHALPNALPPGQLDFDDACSPDGDFGDLRLRFFRAVLDGGGARDVVGSPYSLTTADGSRCLALETLSDRETLAAGVDLELAHDGDGRLSVERAAGLDGRTLARTEGFPGEYDPATATATAAVTETETEGGSVATPTGAGAPVHLELADGPLTVGGVPTLSATVTTVGVDQRVFFALSVGESPATARVVQNNMLPLRESEPVVGADRTVELPGVAVDVADGERLYLTVSAVSDMSFAHGSTRTPGAVALEDLSVGVPTVE